MSAAATPNGATAPPVSYPEPGTGRPIGRSAPDYRVKREDRHLAAVATTLQWADESADREDYFDAVAWLETLEAIGDEFPEVYEIRRRSWSAQLRASRVTDKTACSLKRSDARPCAEPSARDSGRSQVGRGECPFDRPGAAGPALPLLSKGRPSRCRYGDCSSLRLHKT